MSIKDVAIQYIEWNLCALPAIKAKKRPPCSWKAYQQRLPTVAEWEQWSHADAICIVCGKVSGNLLMIDFDQQGKALSDFDDKTPRELFDRLVIEQSQSGGYHVIVRSEVPVAKNTILAKDTDGKTLIETRGEGGLFLCAPTPGYELLQGDIQSIPVLSSNEIETLLSTARSLDQTETAVEVKGGGFCRQTTHRPGDDFNDKGRTFIKKMLEKHGWSFVKVDDGNEYWLRPGKDRQSNWSHSATLKLDAPLFRTFSTNSHPFEGNKTYNFFQVYTILEHSGDYSAAARELAQQGYGDAFLREPVELPKFITKMPEEDDDEEMEDDDDCCSETFPKHLLNVPGFVNELSQFINETSFVQQPVYALAAALAFQALLCAQNVKDPTGIRTNIYLIVAGRSASGKERGRAVIKEIMTRLENTPELKGFYSPSKFILEETASYPALVRHLEANHGALLWLWDEMGVVFPSLNNDRTSYLSGIIPIIMRLYSSADSIFLPHARAAKNETLPTIQQPNLVLYGTSVKEKLFNAFSVDTLTDGFIGRLMIFEGDDSARRCKLHNIPQVPNSIIETTDWWLKKRAMNVNQAIPQPSIVPVTDEAEAIFDRFHQVHEQIQKENNSIKDALWGRSAQQARQFALIYACSVSRDNPIIDRNAAQWAYELVTFLIKRKIYIAKRHVADSDFDRKQKEILRYIESCKGKCTLSMLCRKFRSLKKRERDEILENLFATKAIRTEERPQKNSRKKATFLVLKRE